MKYVMLITQLVTLNSNELNQDVNEVLEAIEIMEAKID